MKKFLEEQDNMQVYDYAFGADFLASIFGQEKYMRKYSMHGDGIYNLLLIEDKIYDLKLREVKSMVINDNQKAYRDATKDYIVAQIVAKLKDNGIIATTNKGKLITFKNNDKIFSVEITKKNVIPA